MKKISVGIILVVIAAVSFWAGGHYDARHPQGSGHQAQRKVLYYSDPMNPGFRSDRPGIAPCGMPLEPVYGDTDENPASLSRGAVKISPDRQQLIGVKVIAVEPQPMTYTLRLYGKVVPDERRVYRVNASTDSWIRELSDVTTGSIVIKDQVLAEALAPAYYNAQVTYLISLDNVDRISQQLGGQLRHQQNDLANNQIRIAVQALQNLGIGDAQVEELANTRQARPYLQVRAPHEGVVMRRNISLNQWFKAAEEFYTIADIGKVWVYADVYENEARHLKAGTTVMVKHAQLGKTFDAKMSDVLPLFDPVSRTLKVRLEINNPGYALRPDMFVDVEIPITMPTSLNVPADAVIDSGTKTVVYVDMGNGVFEPRRVETGWKLGRRIEITGGLMPGEKIVVSGNFLIDSESRMKSAASREYETTFKDPVCGMEVNPELAEKAGRTGFFAGKTFYFCSDKCVHSFRKEPEKYFGKPVIKHALAWPDHVQTGAGKPADRINVITEIKKDGKDDASVSALSPGVIDWDGPKTEKDSTAARDWSGWGKFPGAEYLGLKTKGKKNPGMKPALYGSADHSVAEESEETPSALDDSETDDESQN
jgi:membrane fusion protein, copper/silver efflux system